MQVRAPFPYDLQSVCTGKVAFCALIVLVVAAAFCRPLEASNLPKAPLQACSVLHAQLTDAQVRSRRASNADTIRIQSALDVCSPGKAVVLLADGKRSSFSSGPLRLTRGVTLNIDRDVTLYASTNLRDYDLYPSSCGTTAVKDRPGCKPFLFTYQAAYSGITGAGTIDGQGFRLPGKKNSSVTDVSLPDLVSSYESQGFSVTGITLRNAANAHLSIFKTIGFSASGIRIDASQTSTRSSGILLSNSPDGVIEDVRIHVQREAISIKASILGATSNIAVRNVEIVDGNGISIGDDVYGDVHDIDVQDLAIEGRDAGLFFNFKGTHGGSLRDIRYRNLCMSNRTSLKVEQEDGTYSQALPAGHNISFEPDLKAKCDIHLKEAIAASLSVPDLNAMQKPGVKTNLIVGTEPGQGIDLTSIQKAVDALPSNGGTITLKPGTYREVVTIRKPHVHLRGEESDPMATTIVFNNGASTSGGTFNSATVFVEADDVIIAHMTIANDLGTGKGQAVALSVTGDRAVFKNLRLLGAQDTLFAASKYCYGDYGPCVPARQYFTDCYIEGNIDFIFGDSRAVFDRCELHGLSTGNVMYTAHGQHYAEEYSGWVFNRCRLTADPVADQWHDRTISLGRPWRPHATVIYLNTEIDAPILPQGWTEWPRFGIPSLPIALFAEFNSQGPGAHLADRERYSRQFTDAEAEHWSPATFLAGNDGWNPTSY